MITEARPEPIVHETDQDPCCATPVVPAWGLRSPQTWAAAASLLAVCLVALSSAGMIPGLPPKVLLGEMSRNARFILKAFWEILPYFALSVSVAAWVTVAGYAEKIKRVFAQRQGIAISGAAAVGAAVPFCSCGVIPLVAGLLASGVPLAPVMAFWISSPLMSPEKFVLTAGVLGGHYAAARLIIAVILGASAGFLTYLLGRRGMLNGQIRESVLPAPSCCPSGAEESTQNQATLKGFFTHVRSTTFFLGKWLLLAFFLEALIVHYVNPDWIGAALGGQNPFAIPLATLVGIPLYTSGVAAIPITEGLLKSGMSMGAAMAFLVAGPATCIPAMAGVWAIVKRRTFAIYLATGILGSLAAGYAFQLIMS